MSRTETGGRHLDAELAERRIAGYTPKRLVVLIVIYVAAALFVAWFSWLVVRLADASNHLESAHKRVAVLQEHLVSGDAAAAEADVRAIQTDVARSRSATNGLVVRSAATIPYLGRTAHAARSLSDVAAGLANGPLPRLVTADLALSPNRLRTSSNTIDIVGLQGALTPLSKAVAELDAYTRRLQAVSDGSLVLDPIENARTSLISNIAQVQATTVVAHRVARIAPAMLGANGARRYFVANVNFNETRATGGVLGGYQILEANRGQLRLVGAGPASALPQAEAWRDANLRAEFSEAASIWASLWQRTHNNQRIDGVLSLDPSALSETLEAAGPVRVEGAVLNSKNVIPALTRHYASAKSAKLRDELLSRVSARILNHVLTGAGQSHNLATRLGKASGDGHLRLWSSRPQEQAALTEVPIGGAFSPTPSPYVGLIVNNLGGTKLDTFLERSVTYFADGCSGQQRNTTITVRLSSLVSQEVAPFLNARTDNPAKGTPVGQGRYEVAIYTTFGTRLRSATLDGATARVREVFGEGRPLFVALTTLDRGGSRVLTLQLTEPTAPGAPVIQGQPLLLPQQSTVNAPVCGPR